MSKQGLASSTTSTWGEKRENVSLSISTNCSPTFQQSYAHQDVRPDHLKNPLCTSPHLRPPKPHRLGRGRGDLVCFSVLDNAMCVLPCLPCKMRFSPFLHFLWNARTAQPCRFGLRYKVMLTMWRDWLKNWGSVIRQRTPCWKEWDGRSQDSKTVTM